MSNPYLGGQIAQGIQRVQDYSRQQPFMQERLAEARARRQSAELRLQEQQDTQGAITDVQTQQLQNQLQTLQRQQIRDQSFQAFRHYSQTGNVRHLNSFLQQARNNPIGQQLYTSVRMDPLVDTPDNRRLLRSSGIERPEEVLENLDQFNFVVGTKADGTTELVDMDRVFAATGFTQQLENEQLQALSTRALAFQRLQSGQGIARQGQTERVAASLRQDNPELSFQESIEQASQLLRTGTQQRSSNLSRMAQAIREEYQERGEPVPGEAQLLEEAQSRLRTGGSENERRAQEIAESEGIDYNVALEQVVAEEQRSTQQVVFEEIEAVKTQLDEAFEGNFLEADLSDPAQRRKAGRLVTRIEQEFPMSSEDRRKVGTLRSLTRFADRAGQELTDEETGPIDNILRGVRKYFSDEITGTAGTAAYESFRNTVRNALYGASLTSTEVSAFNKAFGSLSQQLGPALQRLQVQMEDIRTQLTSIYDNNDEYVAKYRLNMSLDEIGSAIDAIDERLEMFEDTRRDQAPEAEDEVGRTVIPTVPLAERARQLRSGQ